MFRQVLRCAVPLMLLLAGIPASVRAGEPEPPQAPGTADPKGTLEIYGFGQADAIVDFKQNNPDWYDVNRPSRLPSSPDQFVQNGHFYLSPLQRPLDKIDSLRLDEPALVDPEIVSLALEA